MTTREIQDEILRLKKEKEVCILAHAYQNHEILEVADYMGDSFALSQQAAKTQEQTILMCGVRFMAETVKVLSPDKKVLLSSGEAGCPMAEQLSVEELKELKKQYPDYTVVAYINTTSELKTLCDVCVTSASAVSIVKKLENDKILFIPDCNLGAWVAEQIPEKTFKFIKGGCPTHLRMGKADVAKAKKAGVVMTPAGAPFPYGKDPHDSVIRISPSYPSLEDLTTAIDIFVVCVKLASIEKLLGE